MISAYVPENTGRYVVYVILSILCALISVGMLMAMLCVYYGNPALLSQITDAIVAPVHRLTRFVRPVKADGDAVRHTPL